MTREELIKKIQHLEDLSSKVMVVNPLLNIFGIVRLFRRANNVAKNGPLNQTYNEVMNHLCSMESDLTPREFYGLRRRVMACKPQ